MSATPPSPGGLPEPGALRCPRCSATVGAEQDWCLECGAPARTRLAPTPNWQLPTVAIGAILALAGALLAFAFVRLTDDGDVRAGTTPTAVVPTAPPPVVPPPVVGTTPPTATSTVPTTTTPPPTAVPGQTATTTTGADGRTTTTTTQPGTATAPATGRTKTEPPATTTRAQTTP